MHKSDLITGHVYLVKVNGKLVPCRLDRIGETPGNRHQRSSTAFHVTNLKTGRTTIFRSAAKFREEVKDITQVVAVMTKPGPFVGEEKDPMRPEADPNRDDYPICPECFAQDEKVHLDLTTGVVTCEHCQGDDDSSDPTGQPSGETTTPTNLVIKAGCPQCLSLPCICQEEEPDYQDEPMEGEHSSDPTLPSTGPVSGLAARLAQVSVSSQKTTHHLEVRALAGTGKTTTAIEGLANAKGLSSTITPSPQQDAVWDGLREGDLSSVRLSSFSTGITNTLKEKVVQRGLDQYGVEAQGIHSLGFGAVRKAFGYHKPSAYRVEEMCVQALGLQRKSDKALLVSTVSKLTSLCKQTMTSPEPENLAQLMSYYDLDWEGPNDELAIAYQLVPDMLEKSKQPPPGADISFDDQIWLPLVHNLPIYKVGTQIVDEAQDLNRMQQELMYRAGHRIIYIGDPNQAIYGFAGADSESMDRMRDHLNASSLPLTVTRRCGRAIVAEAQDIVSDFEAHESNPEGLVGEGIYPLQQREGRKYEVAWEKSYCSQVRDGDFILCRVNAPLVSQCFRFLKKSIPATILGRDIGQGLANIVKRLTNDKAIHIVKFLAKLEDWTKQETEREGAKKFPSEARLISIQDRHECLESFGEDCTTTDDLLRKIDKVFTTGKICPKCGQEPKYDTGDPICYRCRVPLIRRRGVQLSSIHKSKGLEAQRVFFLRPKGGECPHPMAKSGWQRKQERNLLYVGITRAISELYWVE